jgi:PEP-CTERM motif
MSRVLMTLLATASIGLVATSANASAQLQQCSSGASCVSGTTNVNLGTFNSGSSTVTGTVGTQAGAPAVEFTSHGGSTLLETNTGAATVFTADNSLLNQLTFTLLGGASFTAAEFNLERGSLTDVNSPLSITLTAVGGGTSTFNVTGPTGSNIFDIIAGTGESYTSASFSTTNGGFADLKQLRLVLANTTGAVPEPATWAMMLLGFGGIGMAMRRSRRRSAAPTQIA